MSRSKPGRSFSQKLRDIGRIAGTHSPIPFRRDQSREAPQENRFEMVHTPDRLAAGGPTPTEEECLEQIRKWHTDADLERGYIKERYHTGVAELPGSGNPLGLVPEARGRGAGGVLGGKEKDARYEFRDEEEEERVLVAEMKLLRVETQKKEREAEGGIWAGEWDVVAESEGETRKRDTFGFPMDDDDEEEEMGSETIGIYTALAETAVPNPRVVVDYEPYPDFKPRRPHRGDDGLFEQGGLSPADLSIRTTGFFSKAESPATSAVTSAVSPATPATGSDYGSYYDSWGKREGLSSPDEQKGGMVSRHQLRCMKCGRQISGIEAWNCMGCRKDDEDMTLAEVKKQNRETTWLPLSRRPCPGPVPAAPPLMNRSPVSPSPPSPPAKSPMRKRVFNQIAERHLKSVGRQTRAAAEKDTARFTQFPPVSTNTPRISRTHSERESPREHIPLQPRASSTASGNRARQPEDQQQRNGGDDADLVDIYKLYDSYI
ncbi:hypothetical protein B0T16DRAFT_454258 [Cercophora newfieldiana]|uniref:Uncharacterized protein n=1 Tax=Cercophora newfieldiana TaxID=92897 RepID=A0AA39YFS8_9PEZI|nr:hypothetical protein B0T16DRAFT_454258 [Cercophora newfieldiana]